MLEEKIARIIYDFIPHRDFQYVDDLAKAIAELCKEEVKKLVPEKKAEEGHLHTVLINGGYNQAIDTMHDNINKL